MTDTTTKEEKRPITGVWLNGGRSAYLNILPRINFHGVLTVLSSEFVTAPSPNRQTV